MSTRIPSTSTDPKIIVNQLNSLLSALQISISLQSPSGLTPSLLIAILESLLSIRIPIVDHSQPHDVINIQHTKIFLGILETDVLEMDVGLSAIDLRRLARGEMEECLFIAELLCSVGSRLGLIRGQDSAELVDVEAPTTAHSIVDIGSPSTSTTTRQTITSFFTNSFEESNTSIYSSGPSTPTKATSQAPGCIHEFLTPSSRFSPSSETSSLSEDNFHHYDGLASPSYEPTVRYSGYISPVDQDLELRLFDLSRNMSNEMSMQDVNETQSDPTYSLHALRESQAHSLELFASRAHLLDEIAVLKHGKPRPFRDAMPPS